MTPKMIKPSSKKLKVIGTINPAAIRRKDGKIVLYVRVIERVKVLENEKYCYSPRMVGEKRYKIKIDKFNKNNISRSSDFDIIFKDLLNDSIKYAHVDYIFIEEEDIKKIDKE